MTSTVPTFSPEDIAAVRQTFDALTPLSRTFALTFYQTLFELDPSLRSLFHGDMISQGQKLVDMLDFIATNLEDPELLLPAVRALGQRHATYRVAPAHYQTVGTAMLQAMSRVLGDEFTPTAHNAWAKAYEVISAEMIQAAASQ